MRERGGRTVLFQRQCVRSAGCREVPHGGAACRADKISAYEKRHRALRCLAVVGTTGLEPVTSCM